MLKLVSDRVLPLCIGISTILFFIFYPSFYSSNDERNYIQNSFYLLDEEGLVRQNIDCLPIGNETYGFNNGSGCISKYSLGVSIILLPAVLISWNLSFVVVFLFFLISIYIFHKLLLYYKISSFF